METEELYKEIESMNSRLMYLYRKFGNVLSPEEKHQIEQVRFEVHKLLSMLLDKK